LVGPACWRGGTAGLPRVARLLAERLLVEGRLGVTSGAILGTRESLE